MTKEETINAIINFEKNRYQLLENITVINIRKGSAKVFADIIVENENNNPYRYNDCEYDMGTLEFYK